jgi:predicted metalloprotease with PDZ domain
MPVWTPGSYLVREYSAHLERLEARGGGQALLPVVKVAKNRWRVDLDAGDEITVSYDVWAGELNVSTNWVESSQALLNGAGLFLYTDQSRDLPQEVEVRLPSGWTTVHTAMDREENSGRFRVADYDELVDNPILAGNAVEYPIEVAGHPYGVVFSEDSPYWDVERAAEDCARIIEAQQNFWGVNPLERKYLVMTVFAESFAGLEHDHSTVLMTNRLSMRDRKDYRRWLGLVSHEFFHAWNVRRMRPAALSEYDYEQESYIRELWLAEGLTSYYDDLLLFRSGAISVVEYLELLAGEIRNYETTPGREVRSAELASFDTWIKHYRKDENSVNSTVSYYRKGAVIGFVADTAIRRETGGDASLDTVMQTMFRRYGMPSNGGYPPGAFEGIVEEIAGQDVRGMVEAMIRETIDPDVNSALDWYGLALDRNPLGNGAGPPPAGLGMEVDTKGSALLVKQVVAGHSGAGAGVLPGDELIAIDGNRVTAANYDDVLQRMRSGDSVSLTLARNGRLLTTEAEIQPAIPPTFLIKLRDKLSSRQKKRLENWLGRDLVFK